MTHRVSDIEQVSATLEKYIQGSLNADVALLKTIFHPQAGMFGYLGPNLLAGSPEPFFAHLAGGPSLAQAGKPYRAKIASIEVTGNTASAKLVEDGFSDLDFVDYFHLLKVDGKWLIVAKTFHHD
jgi:hypothetical protein